MKILAIHGSPRKNGTSSAIADHLVDRLADPGDEVRKFDLNALDIRGCQECFACRKAGTDACAVRDDLSEALELTKAAEVLVLATPVFYGDVSAQLKCFIDRTWSYFGRTGLSADHLPRNRHLVFVQSYGYPDAGLYDPVFERYTSYFKMYGFDEGHQIKAYGAQHSQPEAVNLGEAMSRAEAVAGQIRQGHRANR